MAEWESDCLTTNRLWRKAEISGAAADSGDRQRARHRSLPAGTDLVGFLLGFLGIYLIGLSLLMLISPGTFFSEIAPFGVQNDHYIRDGGTFQLALGLLALLAVRQPGLRPAALLVISLQFAIHTLNHLVDINESHPHWLGPADFIGLALLSTLAILLLRGTRRSNR
jgi:hypothetical protein